MSKLNELKDRKMRLLEMQKLLELEIRLVNSEIQKADPFRQTRLDQAFFDDKIVPMLGTSGDRGMSSSQMYSELASSGEKMSNGAFRTFVSRYKDRGLLKTVSDAAGRTKWTLT